MFCRQCGKELSDDARFCQYCGCAVSTGAKDTLPNNLRTDDAAVIAKGSSRKLSPRLKKLLVIAGSVVAVILAIVLIVFAVQEHKRTTIVSNIPDPESFFGISGTHYTFSKSFHDIRFKSEDITQDMVMDYVELLCSSEYSFTSRIGAASAGSQKWVFEYNGSEELYEATPWQISLDYHPYDDVPSVEIRISNYRNFELVPVEPYAAGNTNASVNGVGETTQPTTNTPAVTQPVETEPAVQGAVLPDPGAFFGGVSINEDQPSGENGWLLSYRLEIDEGWDAGHEYAELLEEHDFILTDHVESTVLYLKTDRYFFEYTGNHPIEPMTNDYYLDRKDHEYTADVMVSIKKDGQTETTLISVYHSIDLIVHDTGDRASNAPDNASGSGSFNGTDNDIYDSGRPCVICDDGECKTCGGDGYLWSSASDKEDRNCTGAYCRRGSCTYCGGDGWID